MFGKRNEFTFDVRRKGKKGKYIIQFHSKETKQREQKADFTRMKRKDNIHFPSVKLRKVTKKGGNHKERKMKWRE